MSLAVAAPSGGLVRTTQRQAYRLNVRSMNRIENLPPASAGSELVVANDRLLNPIGARDIISGPCSFRSRSVLMFSAELKFVLGQFIRCDESVAESIYVVAAPDTLKATDTNKIIGHVRQLLR
jgi:hypothetical protein